jgi:hypothetical protein
MSRDNGSVFTIGGTVTYENPTVVPWGPVDFMIFHTGDDGNIWYTVVNQDFSNWGSWYAIPNNYTNLSVSAAQMGEGSYQVYLVYRGLGNDLRIWGTWFSGQNGSWSNAENIGGGMGNTSPGVSYNSVSDQLTVTVGGTDNQLWMTNQQVGASGWNNWWPLGVYTVDTPHSAACSNGNMVVSILNGDINGDINPEYAKFNA